MEPLDAHEQFPDIRGHMAQATLDQIFQAACRLTTHECQVPERVGPLLVYEGKNKLVPLKLLMCVSMFNSFRW